MTACLNESRLQAWIDGELSPEAAAGVRLHLSGCAVCAAKAQQVKETLALVDKAWQASLPEAIPATRLRARIEQALTPPPAQAHSLWSWRAVFAHWQIAAAIGCLIIAAAAPVAVRFRQNATATLPPELRVADNNAEPRLESRPQLPRRPDSKRVADRPTWLESETNKHLTQMQLLFRSIRNSESESFSDLAYELELSRELLTRNRLLRRSAELKNETRAEQLLSHIEPVLLDIANAEQTAPDEVRSLRELIRDEQIVAELQLYAGKSLF